MTLQSLEAPALSPEIAREMELETECLDMGMATYRTRTQKLREKQLETVNGYGKNLMARSIEPLSAAISAFITEARLKPGRRHIAMKFLDMIPADVAAFITARQVYDGISIRRPLQRVAILIGGRIEDEARFTEFENDEEKGGLFVAAKKNLENHPLGYQARVKRSMLVHTATKFGIKWTNWSVTDKLHLGTKLIDLFIESVGLVKLTHVSETGSRYSTKLMLEPTEELTRWVGEYNNRAECLAPFYMPMVCTPKPWTGPKDGGYYHKRMCVPLVKTMKASRGYLAELRTREMPAVYNAVNALQATPWRINGAMLTLVKEVWEAGLEVKGVPSRLDKPLPVKPDDIDTNAEAKLAWKRRAGDVFRSNLKAGSKRMQVAKIMYLADKFAAEPAIYFPVTLDFRGRMYAVPQYLNPQGCDLAKGLLTFSEGKALGAEGVRWLAIHLANSFGNDKCGLDARAAWTKEHSDRICRTVNDPLADLWWTEADKPFQFLAACVEWIGYVEQGEAYVCSLPIMVDGSCNGIQHFSAMLRDEVAGQHVNLVPGDKPSDIYAAVAVAVLAALKEENTEWAAKWIELGIDRKTCKRPVMVLPYGGSRNAVRTYLLAHFKDRFEAGEVNPFAKELAKSVTYLAGVVWRVMGQVIVGPRKAMDWLRDASKVVTKQGLPVVWSTPSGFLVHQAYPDVRSRRVDTKVGDQIIKVCIAEDTDKLDGRKQCQAISPNFVHSLDASALVLTIVDCTRRGLTAFAAVHDSYGTLAADMPVMMDSLRSAFVAMYQRHDVLSEFAEEIGGVLPEGKNLPKLPDLGTLNISGVLQSDFFFA